jgi:glutamate--cysteine ligase
MSEFQVADEPRLHEPIASTGELVQYIADGAKPRADWRVGTEHEKVGVLQTTGEAAPFSGPRGIEAVLRGLAERYGWRPKLERGRIIALYGRNANVTVEPGAQLELSGEQCESIHCAHHELVQHVREIVTVASELGIAFLGLGMQPVSTLDEIEWVPKRRYQIMGPYMGRVGTLGQRMMKQTATVQANFDFSDERDAMRKMRVGMGVAPIVSAMFANSPLSDGRLNGFATMRGHIWTDTDSARSGVLPFVFDANAGFEHYVEWALDVPMYFIIRGGEYVELTGTTFRTFLTHGHGAERATLEDWALHLTTLFPEVRLKRYLEVRSADSQPPDTMLALPALMKGVFYHDDALDAAWDLVAKWSWEERVAAYASAHRRGLGGRAGRHSLAELARELLNIGAAGLARQRVLDERGNDESIYLDLIRELVAGGQSLAEILAVRWLGSWNRDVTRLIRDTAYRVAD